LLPDFFMLKNILENKYSKIKYRKSRN